MLLPSLRATLCAHEELHDRKKPVRCLDVAFRCVVADPGMFLRSRARVSPNGDEFVEGPARVPRVEPAGAPAVAHGGGANAGRVLRDAAANADLHQASLRSDLARSDARGESGPANADGQTLGRGADRAQGQVMRRALRAAEPLGRIGAALQDRAPQFGPAREGAVRTRAPAAGLYSRRQGDAAPQAGEEERSGARASEPLRRGLRDFPSRNAHHGAEREENAFEGAEESEQEGSEEEFWEEEAEDTPENMVGVGGRRETPIRERLRRGQSLAAEAFLPEDWEEDNLWDDRGEAEGEEVKEAEGNPDRPRGGASPVVFSSSPPPPLPPGGGDGRDAAPTGHRRRPSQPWGDPHTESSDEEFDQLGAALAAQAEAEAEAKAEARHVAAVTAAVEAERQAAAVANEAAVMKAKASAYLNRLLDHRITSLPPQRRHGAESRDIATAPRDPATSSPPSMAWLGPREWGPGRAIGQPTPPPHTPVPTAALRRTPGICPSRHLRLDRPVRPTPRSRPTTRPIAAGSRAHGDERCPSLPGLRPPPPRRERRTSPARWQICGGS